MQYKHTVILEYFNIENKHFLIMPSSLSRFISKKHHSIWKIIFVLGADEYLGRLEAQIRKCLFFYVY